MTTIARNHREPPGTLFNIARPRVLSEQAELARPVVHKSSGNVFADLAVSEPEDSLAKAKLAGLICQIIRDRKLTQQEAAELIGLDQPKISALIRGKLRGFSAERLFRCLNELGQEVEISVRPAAGNRRRGKTQVLVGSG